MARIRTIKPDYWTDEKIVELTPFARLLFIGLWNFADDEGRMVYSPKKIKMQIFPADSLDVSELVGELRRESLVTVYAIDMIEYLQVNNFDKHQKVDKRFPSKLPIPPSSPRIPPTDAEPSRRNGMEGNGIGKEIKTPAAAAAPVRVNGKKKTQIPENFGNEWTPAMQDWLERRGETQVKAHLLHFVGYARANGKTYADWEQAFQNAIRDDWAGVRKAMN